MVRRTLFGLFPILLTALAFLHSTPGAGAGESFAHAGVVVSPASGVLSEAVVRSNITEDVPDIAVSQGVAADDNSAALIVRVAVAILWPESAFERRILEAGDRAGPNYWPCVAAPRAPPAV